MNDRENVARDGEYAALSRRIVDVVLDTFGCNLGSDGPEILCQAQDKVNAELAGQFSKHHGGLGDVKERTRLEAHLRFQTEALSELASTLEQERDLLSTIMDSTQAQIAYLDPEFSFVQVNDAYCQGSGYDKVELIGCNHFDLFPNDENKAVFERVRDTGEAVFFRAKPFTFPDRPELGPTYWDWRLAATKDRDGNVAGLVLSLYDVTERERARLVQEELLQENRSQLQQARLLAQVQRHAEELEHQVRRRTAALRVSRARFQAIFEEAAIGIALVNRKGRILDSNPALQHMLGYHPDELEGMLFSDLAHSDNVTDDAELYEELVGGQRTFYRVEGCYVRKDGQPIDANLIVSLVRPAKGRARLAVALVEDVTEAKQAQAALIESEKLALTGRMAASLAHEINNPLQSVIGCLSLAEEDMAQGKDALQYVTIALEELERAADLIARMRDLSRPHEPDEQVSTDVNALLERVLALTKKKCEERHVEVAWNPGADVPKPTIVADRMQQVFLNLVLNAVDAMPDGGRLEVRTARTDDSQGIEVRFSDTGDGVPADDLSHLFEPFYTTKSTGMGLGLYVSQGIVKDHGGRIDVESIEGEGTTFTMWLPV